MRTTLCAEGMKTEEENFYYNILPETSFKFTCARHQLDCTLCTKEVPGRKRQMKSACSQHNRRHLGCDAPNNGLRERPALNHKR